MATISNYSNSEFSFQKPIQEGSEINPGKNGLKTAISNGSSWAATGSQAGPWGTAIGAAAGIGSGIVDMFGSAKRRDKENELLADKQTSEEAAYNEEVEGQLARRSASQNGEYFQNYFAKKGGTIPKKDTLSVDIFMRKLSKRKEDHSPDDSMEIIYRHGGAMSVIPKGVTHEQHNQMGDKGIPVVVKSEDGTYKKVAEIELNEIIFEKEVSEAIEKRTKHYKKFPKDMENLYELGKLIKSEVKHNTIDHQGELLK